MPGKTAYIDYYALNDLQTVIMHEIITWVHDQKTPVPQKQLIILMQLKGTKSFTTINALNGLLQKGYIRRAYTLSRKTYYVQLKTV